MGNKKITQHVLRDDIIIINPGRTLDNDNSLEMAEAISNAKRQRYKYVIIDMVHLEFLSSAGVGSILGTMEMIREGGGDIIICNASRAILHVFEVLDLTDYLTIKANENEAVAVCDIGA